ncbi:MAG TPA: PD-(D/E)XK nuclease family protein [Desulfobacteraceae bacterium]|nr:PD-(D/E)XK nuclease family protein [Desulfobacteraceae bacterium]
MKIHYSPHFDGEHYIDYQGRDNLFIDELAVGDSGLLSQLELRSGMPCECLSESERQAGYYNAVKAVIESRPDNPITDSFKADEYGVASELLRWRDELIAAGWHPGIRDVSAKLDLLSDIETHITGSGINIRGESDRLIALINCKTSLLQKDDEVHVHFPAEYISPVIAKLLRKLTDDGITITYMVPGKSIAADGTNLKMVQDAFLTNATELRIPVNDDSFRIVKFDTQGSALEWVVKSTYSKGTVFINSDNRSFDNIQLLYGDPMSGSSLKDANPEIIQLFKLGCSLFLRPLNIYNLLSYLQISRHPLPFELRRGLIEVIVSEGGIINPEWENVLEEYFKNAGKNKKKDITVFLPVDGEGGAEIDANRLKEFVKALRTWAGQYLIIMRKDKSGSNNPLINKQLTLLVNFCNALMIILNGYNQATVNNEKLKSWILSIYKPGSYTASEAEAGSRFILASPAAFVDQAEAVTWIDCYNGTPKATVHRFLSKAEKEALAKLNLIIWSEEAQIRAQLYEQKMAILNCRSKFTLVAAEKDKGEKLALHPVLIQLSAQFENLETIESANPAPAGESIEVERIDLPSSQLMIEMEQQNMFTPRQKESYSSVYEMVQNPLDYVLNHHAGLSYSSVLEMSDESRTMGNVAHLFIQNLVDESDMNLTIMREVMSNDYQNRFNKAVLQKGAILLLDENKILLSRFAGQVRQSVSSLLDIIEQNGLKICGCEVVKECRFEGLFDMEARIDMLLYDNGGKYLIFDMKWSSGRTYNKLMEANRALQLEIYRAVLKKAEPAKQVFTVAYFILTNGTLLTTGHLTGKNVKVLTPENGNDIFEQAMNSYAYRWEQLREGKIESAEKMALELLDYHRDAQQQNLYPLDADYGNKDLKAENVFSNFKTFKGGLK